MSPAAARRLLHASSALVLLLYSLGSANLIRYGLMVATVFAVAVDSLRIIKPAFSTFITALVPVFRASESTRWSGATWLCFGYAVAAWFPHPAVTAGILVGAFADPAASWAGATLADPSKKKTWIGSGAAAIVAALLLWIVGLPLITVACGALGAMLIERWSAPLNDNLVVAPAVALLVWLTL